MSKPGQFIVVNGSVLSVKDVAEIKGLHRATIYKRLKQGQSLEDIFYQSEHGRYKNLYRYKGKSYTVVELLRYAHSSVTAKVLRDRLNLGWTLEKSLSIPVGEMVGKKNVVPKYLYKGTIYSLSQLLSLPECVVSKATLHKRLNKLNWPVEKALTSPTWRDSSEEIF